MKKFFLLAVVLIVIDQITKWYFQGKFIPVWEFVNFNYVENTGSAFGLFQNMNLVFIVLSFVVIPIMVYYWKRYPLAISFLLAGTVGNLIDRLLFGFVRDFISVSVWPVFNVADSCNTIGVLLLLYTFYQEEKAYKQSGHKKE